jgi:signal transduction histidine kinase
MGISPENLVRIMEPLYSTKAKGIGLGLSIAQEIVTRHHGTLRASSEPGRGSTFTICLPKSP